MAARNRKGQFVKGGRKSTAITKPAHRAPARRAAAAPAAPAKRRRHKSGGLFGARHGVLGRLLPDERQVVSAGAGYGIGWLERGMALPADDDTLQSKVAKAVPDLWTEGGFVGNLAIVLQLANAVMPHRYLQTSRDAATAILAEKWAKRGGKAASADDTSGADDGGDDDTSGDDDDDTSGDEGWLDPDQFGNAAA